MLWVVPFFWGGVISAVVDVKLLGEKCVSFACRNWFLLEMGETRKVGLIVNHGSIHKRFKKQLQINMYSISAWFSERKKKRRTISHTWPSRLNHLHPFFEVTQDGPKRFRSIAHSEASTSTSFHTDGTGRGKGGWKPGFRRVPTNWCLDGIRYTIFASVTPRSSRESFMPFKKREGTRHYGVP